MQTLPAGFPHLAHACKSKAAERPTSYLAFFKKRFNVQRADFCVRDYAL